MKVNNKTIWFIIPIITNIIAFYGWWKFGIKHSNGAPGWYIFTGVFSGIIDFVVLLFLFLECMVNNIQFEINLNPFVGYMKRRKEKKEIKDKIHRLKIKLAKCNPTDDKRINNLYKQIEVLTAEKYNNYEKNN